MKCNEMKVKVNKRGRKLVDFDGARRNLNALQNAKKLEESKLLKVCQLIKPLRDVCLCVGIRNRAKFVNETTFYREAM